VQPVIDPAFLKVAMEFMSKGPVAAPAAAALVAASYRKAFAAELRRYGEDSVAAAVEASTDQTVLSIGPRGMQMAFSGENIPRALCLAAVEVIEGQPRPLARKRRKRVT
jgi:hypothetical protein